MKKIISIFLLAFVLISCKTDEFDYKFVLDKYKKHNDSLIVDSNNITNQVIFQERKYYDASLVTLFKYNEIEKNIPVSILSFFLKKRYGHSFFFNSKGKMVRYLYFLGKDLNVSYEIEISKDGKMENEYGSVVVDYIKHEKFISVFLSNVIYTNIEVKISTPKQKPIRLPLFPSALQPLLLEGKINEPNSNVYFLKTNCLQKRSNKKTIFYDTIIVR